jgi:alpha-D-ribose 1-methylphosphonate 5-triphosphate synthase subunit PhnL
MLRRLEVPADLHDGFPVLFSGGEQQRVNVARSLIVLPRLLLLDEPTSALDPVNQRMVTALLREAKLGGTTIVAVLHDLELVRRLADRYLLLHQGQLVDEGPASSAALAGNVVR